ncbi:putative inosine-uridine preferring nucleoside hydrolase-like [Apostichopus japonicus]|uniref:Putative inosine-uridine preferring nucleoside hydrolase-like n=1 Tax=Stichopus japonicus TaxID=307972 RepID=A0A2G8K161_STIJA|nr:putative inosine-uridine preferring nucleoside hydrolase-like [Apostichopus japonicus]
MSSVGPVIVDCDVGVDDAVAIALCVANAVDIIGITCVHGNTSLGNVLANTEWLLRVLAKKEIPIYKGADRNLVGESMCAVEFHGEGGLGGVSIPNQPAEGDICREEHAVTALLRLTKERPGEITLLAIGPLTNVALAIRLDPGFTKRLKSLIIMGGDITGKGASDSPVAEFNFHSDPEAADVVLRETECPVTVVPFETCYATPLPNEFTKSLNSTPTQICRFLSEITSHSLSKQRKDNIQGFVMCDALAAAVLIDRDIMKQSRVGPVCVERSGIYSRGQMIELRTTWHKKKYPGPDITILVKADVNKFHKLMQKILSL